MSDFIFPQENGQNLMISYTVGESGRGLITVRPDEGALFRKKLSDGRKSMPCPCNGMGRF